METTHGFIVRTTQRCVIKHWPNADAQTAHKSTLRRHSKPPASPTPIAYPPPQKSPAHWFPRGSDRGPMVIGIIEANCCGSDLIIGLLDRIGVDTLGAEQFSKAIGPLLFLLGALAFLLGALLGGFSALLFLLDLFDAPGQ
jgi:hypothetical protein